MFLCAFKVGGLHLPGCACEGQGAVQESDLSFHSLVPREQTPSTKFGSECKGKDPLDKTVVQTITTLVTFIKERKHNIFKSNIFISLCRWSLHYMYLLSLNIESVLKLGWDNVPWTYRSPTSAEDKSRCYPYNSTGFKAARKLSVLSPGLPTYFVILDRLSIPWNKRSCSSFICKMNKQHLSKSSGTEANSSVLKTTSVPPC